MDSKGQKYLDKKPFKKELPKALTIDESLENPEANNRLLKFIQILMQINEREKLVKYAAND